MFCLRQLIGVSILEYVLVQVISTVSASIFSVLSPAARGTSGSDTSLRSRLVIWSCIFACAFPIHPDVPRIHLSDAGTMDWGMARWSIRATSRMVDTGSVSE
jgi:hypothetical protein